ncbi:MAG TPA: FecR family protein, partial [Leptospiraceae bacterium]|nr:FecR family protein [Leptospiraceae bacterium]
TFRVSDRIKTGNGILDIQIGTNSVVRIGKNTAFLLTKLFEENGTVKVNLNLNEGSALAKVVKKMEKGSEFKITTPTKTAGVRGTQFMVQEGQDSTSKSESEKIPDGIFVKEGEVTVKAAYSQRQISVKAGEELITAQKKIQAQMLDSFMKEKLRILETLNVLQEENYKLLQEQYRKNQELLKK